MSHQTYQVPNGDWSAVVVPHPVWFSGLDRGVFKSVNGDDGGTWAPTSPIIIGGSGLEVPGPFSAPNVTGLIDVKSGGQVRLESGASLVAAAGAHALINAGASLVVPGKVEIQAGGVLELDATVDPTYGAPRTVQRTGLRFIAATDGGGPTATNTTVGTNPDAWVTTPWGGCVVTRTLQTRTGELVLLELPDPIPGATLVSVSFVSLGTQIAKPTSFPTYNVTRSGLPLNSNVAGLASSGPVTDQHASTGTWALTAETTVLVCDQNNTNLDPGAFKYIIEIQPPASSNGAGTAMAIVSVTATYLVTSLRR